MLEIFPVSFMSDDAPAYHNAWVRVFGNSVCKFLCTWHVQSNLNIYLIKIKNPEKKNSIKNKLPPLSMNWMKPHLLNL